MEKCATNVSFREPTAEAGVSAASMNDVVINGTAKVTLDDLKRTLDRSRAPRGEPKAVSLTKLRDIVGKSQSDVARSMGVAQSQVSRIEGGSDVRLSTLGGYLNALDVDAKITVAYNGRAYTLRLSDLRD